MSEDELKLYKKKISSTMNSAQKILKIIYACCIIAIIICIIRLIAYNVIDLNSLIAKGWGCPGRISLGKDVYIKLSGLDMDLGQWLRFENVSSICFIAVAIISMFILKNFMQIALVIKESSPFTKKCVKAIKSIGICVIFLGFIVPICRSIIQFYELKLIPENLFASASNFNGLAFEIHFIDIFLVIAGFIIILLSEIFKYGCYLQEEHDSTV